ncbi:phosphoribosylformylglycinamidine (FGAM) synthase PurS component [Oikeobacillus pervagus]|uniref:Phosphoribosylformylglycinamidine (FGAM) synthase PurS component n=1 Tax=Oikeobacillus pervagus TaxID=1325931 RepID=A0AAJ1SZN6_9BACI|nr:phosphoribosylformylglycinamidine (FGAM) synthase PurS component [Oikeobacillus pervagus]
MLLKKSRQPNDTFIQSISELLGHPDDLVVKNLLQNSVTIIYTNGLIDHGQLKRTVKIIEEWSTPNLTKTQYSKVLSMELEKISTVQIEEKPESMVNDLLSGSIMVIIEGVSKVLSLNIASSEKRTLQEPATESLIRGPRIGFIENIDTNIT